MKAMYTYIKLLIITAIFLGCQNDIDIDTSNNNTNNSESVFTSKVKRTSMFNGAFDDILDNSPCFAIQYPVDIIVNNNEITINNVTDLNILTSVDIIDISFPIIITNYDYSETTINNKDEFDSAVSFCNALIDMNSGPLNCIDFNYPIQLFTSTDNQEQNIFDITSNQELYFFIENLDNSTLYSFNYPIEITENNSGSIIIENDIALDTYIDICN